MESEEEDEFKDREGKKRGLDLVVWYLYVNEISRGINER